MRLLTATVILALGFPVYSFPPSDSHILTGWGLLGRTHGRMTTASWTQASKEFFGINTPTPSMNSALQTVINANAAVDDDQTRAELHFDGESFPEGQARLISLSSQIISAVKAHNAELARNLLGQALHSIQDFYTHTNWVEMGNWVPYPGLGEEGVVINRLPANISTCVDCVFNLFGSNDCWRNIVTPELTSGYYHGENRVKPMRTKCNHGGLLDKWPAVDTSRWTNTADGINKDTRSDTWSPHSDWHDRAADIATEATTQYFSHLKGKLSPDELRVLFGVDTSVSVVASQNRQRAIARSLGNSTSIIKRGLQSEIHTIEMDSRFVRTTFMDFQAKHTLRRRDFEDTMTGLADAIIDTPRGSVLFVYADRSTDLITPDINAVATLAILGDIKVYVLLFGEAGDIDSDWYDIAHFTGGQVFHLGKSSHEPAASIIKTLVRNDGVTVFYASKPTFTSFTMPIDSTLKNITISISGAPRSVIVKPSGDPLDLADPSVSTVTYPGGFLVTVTSPQSGVWSINLSGAGADPVSIAVTGSSAFDMGLEFTELRGRPGHMGYSTLWGRPASNTTIHAEAYVPNDDANAIYNAQYITFDRRAPSGELLDNPLNLTGIANNTGSMDGGDYLRLYTAENDTNILPYGQDFFVYGNGVHNCSNEQYQRLLTSYIGPSWIEITTPISSTIHPGSNRTMTVLVSNHGNHTAIMDISLFDSSGYIHDGNSDQDVVKSTVEVAVNGTAEVQFQLNVPVDAQTSDADVIMIVASPQGEDEAFNFSYIEQWIVEGVSEVDHYHYNGTMGY